jgi:hypothetical protein
MFAPASMPEQPMPKHPKKDLSAEQKVAFLLLMILGVGGLILGFRSFITNLSRPFDLQIAEYAGELFLTPSQQQENELERQKLLDTDGDGLSDYDELNVFKTSAYLEDSDSDGFNDYEEVYSGDDPNCPRDRDCNSQVASLESEGENTIDVDDLVPESGSGLVEELIVGGGVEDESDVYALLGALSVEEIRVMLLDAGMQQSQIDALDDDELMAVFNEALSQTQASGEIEAFLEEATQDTSVSEEQNTQ